MITKFNFLRSKKLFSVLVLLATISIAPSANAELMHTPMGVTSNVATRSGFPYRLDALIDQSGLSSTYVSGVTDFDTYIGSNPTHSGSIPALWATNNSVTSAQLTFDLGGTFSVQKLALWNRGLSTQGIRNFSILASDDSSFASSINLGSFTAGTPGSNSANLPEAFTFAPTTTSFIRLDIHNSRSSVVLSAGEVAFGVETAAVPEPGSLTLMSLAGLVFARRRRAKMA